MYIVLGVALGLVLALVSTVITMSGSSRFSPEENGIGQKKNMEETKYGKNTTGVVYTITTNATPNEKFTGTYRQAMEYIVQKEYRGFDPDVINKKFGNVK